MTPERALEIRLGLSRKKSVAPLKTRKQTSAASELMKRVLVFDHSEFHFIMHSVHFFQMPIGQIGVLYRKAVYPIRNSGEYLFIDISEGKITKKACSALNTKEHILKQIRRTPSDSLQTLAEKFTEHPDGRKLRKLAAKKADDPALVVAPTRTPTSAMTYAERWLRQLNLSQNQTASEAVRRQALVSLEQIEKEMAALDDHFKWPSTEAGTGSGNLKSFDAPPEGVLSFFGYKVGKSSELRPSTRFHILDRVYRIDLPPVLPRSHMVLWGPPNSGARLKKIAETIAALVRNAKRRRNPSYNQAINEWEFDLQCLHDTLYLGRFSFGWPESV